MKNSKLIWILWRKN